MKLWIGRLALSVVIVGPVAGTGWAQEAPSTATAPAVSPFSDEALDAIALPMDALRSDGLSEAAARSDRPTGDGRRTLGAFPKNLGRGFLGVFSAESLAPFLVGGTAAFASHSLDQSAASALDGRCGPCGRTGATVGGAAIVPFVGMAFVAGRLAPSGSTFRSASYDAAQALIVNGAWTGLLKYSLQRTRPDGSDSLSLPSGHTSTAFALATVAERHYGWKAGLPAYALAAGIGLSRMESSKHYLSDVIAGATIGTIVGRTVARVNGGRASSRTLAIGPATDPHGAGLGLGLSASW
jgi:membrane-associated phospholipid phosphatase